MLLFLIIALTCQPIYYPTKLDLTKTKRAFINNCQTPDAVPWIVKPSRVEAGYNLFVITDSALVVKATFDITLARNKGPTIQESQCLYNYAGAAFGVPVVSWLRKVVKRSLKSLKNRQVLLYRGLLFELTKVRIGKAPDIHSLKFTGYQF